MEPGANFSFELNGNCGAALATKRQTFIEYASLLGNFYKYASLHHKSWVKFARDKGYEDGVRPVLIYGVDLTEEFAMTAYSYKNISLDAGLTADVPSLTSISASLWCTWHTICTPHMNHGPQERTPPSLEPAADPSPSRETQERATPGSFCQSVFVRYYTSQRGFPKVIRAGAGPHDLGPGDNAGGTFPELVVRSGPEPTDDIVIRKMPDVRFPRYFIASALNLPPA